MQSRSKRSRLLLSTALALILDPGLADPGRLRRRRDESGNSDAVGEALTLQQHLVAEMGPISRPMATPCRRATPN